MPRKGQMSDQDAADELIRAGATHYNVVVFTPQHNSKVQFSSNDLEDAIAYAENVYNEDMPLVPRSAMVYAVDNADRFALMGTTNRNDQKYKPNKVKIY